MTYVAVDGEGCCRSTRQVGPVDRLVPGEITSEAILRLFGRLMLMVGWRVSISGHFDKEACLCWPS